MTETFLGDIHVRYRYDAQGLRTSKESTQFGETVYPDRMYQEHFSRVGSPTATKHIFVGQTRIASKVHLREQNASNRMEYMRRNTFTYHGDHLGGTHWVTDYEGEGYEHFQYTPYGEAWVSEHLSDKLTEMSRRFTGQELDQETGLYSFPARYYDPRTSRWLGVDPAMGEYIPASGQSSGDLRGLGGVFNYVNLNVYRYGGNNPLKYVDPDGREITSTQLQEAFDDWVMNRDSSLDVADNDVHTWIGMVAIREGRIPSAEELTEYAQRAAPAERGFVAVMHIFLGGQINGFRDLRGLFGDGRARLSNKLNYLFGRATGSAHNIQRSRGMLQQLQRIGLDDTPAARRFLRRHLSSVLSDSSSIVRTQANGRIVRESLLMGPRGGVKLETIWEGRRLITARIFGAAP